MSQNASTDDKQRELDVIGSTEYISVLNHKDIPAKIDTGADSSSIWASDIKVEEDGTLSFKLFAPESSHYSGIELKSKEYTVSVIRSSNGQEQIRYRTKLPIEINGHTITTSITLANRKRNNFPILIGRKTISGVFLVDVSQSKVKRPKKNPKLRPLQEELKENPYKFHQKYIEKGSKK